MKILNKEQQKQFILNLSRILEENRSILKEYYINGNLNLSRKQIYTKIIFNNKIIERNIIKLFEGKK
jgi:hypothetical protein